MTWSFHPKPLLLAVLFLGVFGLLLTRAAGVESAAAGAGVFAVIAYLVVELLVSFNPAIWRRRERPAAPRRP